MTNDLANITVLVTRPLPQAQKLCDMIQTAAGNAVLFPTIAFSPPSDWQQFQASLTVLGEQDWLVFISPQAVYASIPEIRRAWPHLPPNVKFAAVGKGTQAALSAAGYNVAQYPQTNAGSDGLLAMLEFQKPAGLKIAVIRGLGGRELIDKTLAERGAIVTTLIAYERILPIVDAEPIIKLINENHINVMICTSFEGVKNLKILLGPNAWEKLKKIPLIVVSERIKMLAINLGFETIWVTQAMSDEAIMGLLIENVAWIDPERSVGEIQEHRL